MKTDKGRLSYKAPGEHAPTIAQFQCYVPAGSEDPAPIVVWSSHVNRPLPGLDFSQSPALPGKILNAG
jgi:hypothetical protein